MKRLTVVALAIVLGFSIVPTSSAAVKAGQSCTKLGSTSILNLKKFTCIKVNKKLVWNAGVNLVKPTPSVSPTPAQSPSKDSQTYSLVSKIESVELCKIADQRVTKLQPNNVGFPMTQGEIPYLGKVKVAVIPVDFPDATGVGSPRDKVDPLLAKMNQWAAQFSNGKMTFDFQTSDSWIRSPKPSADLAFQKAQIGVNDPTTAQQNEYSQAFINASGDKFNFTGVSAIIYYFPATVQGIEYDFGQRNQLMQTKQGQINVMYWGGGKYHYSNIGRVSGEVKQSLFWSFWIHEILHSQGFPLHAPGNGFVTSLATDQYGESGAIDSWSTFKAGWLNDDQVVCADKSSLKNSFIQLTPLDKIVMGIKSTIIKISNHEVLIVESRKPIDWSSNWPKDASGLMVYKVDTTKDNDRTGESSGDTGNEERYSKWGYYLAPDGATLDTNQSRDFRNYLLKEGKSVTYSNVKVTLVKAGDNDIIQIQRVS